MEQPNNPNPVSVAHACNDLIDAKPDLQGMVLLAFTIEKVAKDFNAVDRAGLSTILIQLAQRIGSDEGSTRVTHH